jgi:uncharacterized membrane protein
MQYNDGEPSTIFKPMLSDRRPFILLPLAALFAIAPLLLYGCSCGHDFDFHLINWFEAARQLTHGTLHPHWAFTPAWNAGEPRFVFYPPLSWVIGALLGLLMPWTWTPIVYIWIVLTTAGFAFYYTARSYASPNAALVAAAIYIANPYMLYTAYERGAYAELLAAAWLPLALHAVLRRNVTIPSVAIPIALLWLTNAPAAVMGCYATAFIVLIRLALSSTRRDSPTPLLLNSTLGVLLGLGLSSFYLLPAAYERRFVQIDYAILPGLRPWDNFLFQRTTDPEHDTVLFTASVVALLLVVLTAIALLLSARRDTAEDLSQPSPKTSTSTMPLIPLTVVLVLMLTPLSAPLWRHLPELRFLQFPWRFLAVIAVIFALATARTLSRLSLRASATTALLCAAVFALPSYYALHQRCYPEDTVPERLLVFRSANPGTDPTDEYTPLTADNDSLAQTNPGYWLGTSAETPAPPSSTSSTAPLQLDLTPATPTVLILNLRDYPAWSITRNHALVTTRLHRKDGLIAIPLPAGPAHLEIHYATLPDQRLGYLLTALSILTLILLLLRAANTHRRNSPESSIC